MWLFIFCEELNDIHLLYEWHKQSVAQKIFAICGIFERLIHLKSIKFYLKHCICLQTNTRIVNTVRTFPQATHLIIVYLSTFTWEAKLRNTIRQALLYHNSYTWALLFCEIIHSPHASKCQTLSNVSICPLKSVTTMNCSHIETLLHLCFCSVYDKNLFILYHSNVKSWNCCRRLYKYWHATTCES